MGTQARQALRRLVRLKQQSGYQLDVSGQIILGDAIEFIERSLTIGSGTKGEHLSETGFDEALNIRKGIGLGVEKATSPYAQKAPKEQVPTFTL